MNSEIMGGNDVNSIDLQYMLMTGVAAGAACRLSARRSSLSSVARRR